MGDGGVPDLRRNYAEKAPALTSLSEERESTSVVGETVGEVGGGKGSVEGEGF